MEGKVESACERPRVVPGFSLVSHPRGRMEGKVESACERLEDNGDVPG